MQTNDPPDRTESELVSLRDENETAVQCTRSLTEGADLPRLQPTTDAVEVEGMVADTCDKGPENVNYKLHVSVGINLLIRSGLPPIRPSRHA